MTENTTDVLDCGRSIHDLSAYLASDRIPRDPHIESCPECLNALEGLAGMSKLSHELFAEDVAVLPEAPENWLQGIMANIQNEVRAGRSLPLRHPDPRVRLSITEGAVRALIRSVGDHIPGIVIGRCRLDGDVEVSGAPIQVSITASIAWGQSVADLTTLLRQRVYDALDQHTELNLVAVDIVVEDLHVDAIEGEQP